jgi:pSer/pThr/pTyr-binding forkhead associated (FHA) protein
MSTPTSNVPSFHQTVSEATVLSSATVSNLQQVPVLVFPFLIGRDTHCQLRLSDRQVSREHCVLDRSNGRLVLKDLGSRNGTLINSRRIYGAAEVKPGDVLLVGRTALQLQMQPALEGMSPAEGSVFLLWQAHNALKPSH